MVGTTVCLKISSHKFFVNLGNLPNVKMRISGQMQDDSFAEILKLASGVSKKKKKGKKKKKVSYVKLEIWLEVDYWPFSDKLLARRC